MRCGGRRAHRGLPLWRWSHRCGDLTTTLGTGRRPRVTPTGTIPVALKGDARPPPARPGRVSSRGQPAIAWGTKERQETVPAVELSRAGFEWALRNACLSHYVRSPHENQATWKRELKRAPARVQWDPERDPRLRPLPCRSLRLGFSGEAARRHADEWTVTIRDVTPLVHEVHALVSVGDLASATRLLPQEGFHTGQAEPIAHLQG
ncbi:DUF4291 family protein [Streptomyces sp. NPDC091209]|uniref:DUF4291 family protein n=1 Tax=Streptomyces sp. NPDC091209 TaxID=3365974 RepID=UPI0038289DB9